MYSIQAPVKSCYLASVSVSRELHYIEMFRNSNLLSAKTSADFTPNNTFSNTNLV